RGRRVAAVVLLVVLAAACGQYTGVHQRAVEGGSLFSHPVPSIPTKGSSEPRGSHTASPTPPPPSPPPQTGPSPTVIPANTDPSVTVSGGTAVPGGTRIFRVPSAIKG